MARGRAKASAEEYEDVAQCGIHLFANIDVFAGTRLAPTRREPSMRSKPFTNCVLTISPLKSAIAVSLFAGTTLLAASPWQVAQPTVTVKCPLTIGGSFDATTEA